MTTELEKLLSRNSEIKAENTLLRKRLSASVDKIADLDGEIETLRNKVVFIIRDLWRPGAPPELREEIISNLKKLWEGDPSLSES